MNRYFSHFTNSGKAGHFRVSRLSATHDTLTSASGWRGRDMTTEDQTRSGDEEPTGIRRRLPVSRRKKVLVNGVCLALLAIVGLILLFPQLPLIALWNVKGRPGQTLAGRKFWVPVLSCVHVTENPEKYGFLVCIGSGWRWHLPDIIRVAHLPTEDLKPETVRNRQREWLARCGCSWQHIATDTSTTTSVGSALVSGGCNDKGVVLVCTVPDTGWDIIFMGRLSKAGELFTFLTQNGFPEEVLSRVRGVCAVLSKNEIERTGKSRADIPLSGKAITNSQ